MGRDSALNSTCGIAETFPILQYEDPFMLCVNTCDPFTGEGKVELKRFIVLGECAEWPQKTRRKSGLSHRLREVQKVRIDPGSTPLRYLYGFSNISGSASQFVLEVGPRDHAFPANRKPSSKTVF
jgi:hypothetical protein